LRLIGAFMVSSYPRDQLWRPILIAALFMVLLFHLIPSTAQGLNAILLISRSWPASCCWAVGSEAM
jgi:hypothetical protein